MTVDCIDTTCINSLTETVFPVPRKLACVTEKLPTKPSSELAPAPSLTEPVFFSFTATVKSTWSEIPGTETVLISTAFKILGSF